MCVCVSVPSGTDQRTKRNETKPSNQPNPTQLNDEKTYQDMTKNKSSKEKKYFRFRFFTYTMQVNSKEWTIALMARNNATLLSLSLSFDKYSHPIRNAVERNQTNLSGGGLIDWKKSVNSDASSGDTFKSL